MRSCTLYLTAATLLAALPAAHAEPLSYRYVDVAHFPKANIDEDYIDEDGDGLQLRGSLPVYQNFFAYTEFQTLDFDRDIDTTRLMIGGGGHWPLNNKFDIIAKLGIVHYEVDAGRFDDDDTGIFLSGRVRTLVIPKLEVEGGIEHQRVEVFGFENDTYLVGEARYNFTPQWSAGVIVNVGGDVDLIGVHGRFSF